MKILCLFGICILISSLGVAAKELNEKIYISSKEVEVIGDTITDSYLIRGDSLGTLRGFMLEFEFSNDIDPDCISWDCLSIIDNPLLLIQYEKERKLCRISVVKSGVGKPKNIGNKLGTLNIKQALNSEYAIKIINIATCDDKFNVNSNSLYEKRHETQIEEINNYSVAENEIPEITRTCITGIYPNPFNPVVNIKYSVKSNLNVNITIYDCSGKLVKTLVNEFKPRGNYSIDWYGKDKNKSYVASGVYFLRFITNEHSETKKLVLLK